MQIRSQSKSGITLNALIEVADVFCIDTKKLDN